MIFLQCFGAFSVPLIAGGDYQPIGVKIYTRRQRLSRLAAGQRHGGGDGHDPGRAGDRLSARRTQPARQHEAWRAAARCCAASLIAFVLFITLPLVMILLEAFGADWFGVRMLPGKLDAEAGSSGRRRPSISAPFCSIPPKSRCSRRRLRWSSRIPAAWAIARYRLPLKSVLIGAILFPRMIPEITFALGVATHLLRNSPDQHGDRHRAGARDPGCAVRRGGADQHLRGHGRAASGSRRGNGLRSAQPVPAGDVPLALPGIVAAALFSFLASYNDFVLTLMVYGADTVTLPVQTYLSLGNGYLSVAARHQHHSARPVASVPARHAAHGESGKPARRAEGRMTEVRLALRAYRQELGPAAWPCRI